jgi:hypothetical protein
MVLTWTREVQDFLLEGKMTTVCLAMTFLHAYLVAGASLNARGRGLVALSVSGYVSRSDNIPA